MNPSSATPRRTSPPRRMCGRTISTSRTSTPTPWASRQSLADFEPRQPYRLGFFGEKTSLEDVLGPLAVEFSADLYLTGGQISDTLMHGMASDAVADGRPLVVFTFSDFDPAGYWDMPTAIGRKLQALRDLLFPTPRIHRRACGARPRTGARTRTAVVAAEGGRKARRQMAGALRLGANRNRRAGDPAPRRAGADRPRGRRALFRRRACQRASGPPKPSGRTAFEPRSTHRSTTMRLDDAQGPRRAPRSTSFGRSTPSWPTMAADIEVTEPPDLPEADMDALEEAQDERRDSVLIDSDMDFAEAVDRLKAHSEKAARRRL